jgi:hypothetical protein
VHSDCGSFLHWRSFLKNLLGAASATDAFPLPFPRRLVRDPLIPERFL